MKTIKLMSIVFLFSMVFVTSANAVVVSGFGETEEKAILSGLRNAVEQVAGVYLYAETTVEDFKVAKDKIVATGGGAIKKWRLLQKKSSPDGGWFVTLKVDVDVNKLEQDVRTIQTFDDVMNDYYRTKNRMEQLKKFREMLKMLVNLPTSRKYTAIYEGYQILETYPEKVVVRLYVRMVQNQAYWDLYRRIIREVSTKKGPDEFKYFLNYRKVGGKLTADTYYINRSEYPLDPDADVCLAVSNPGLDIYTKFFSHEYRDNLKVKYNHQEQMSNLKRFVSGKYVADGLNVLKDSTIIPEQGLLGTYRYELNDPEQIKQLPNLQIKFINLEDVGKKDWNQL